MVSERIGGASYEIDVSLVKADAKLRQFEQNVGVTGQRADAALRTGFREAGGIAPKLDKAAESTKKLTSSQIALRSAARGGATALATSVPVAGQFGVAVGGIAAALPAVSIGILGMAAGFQILNAAAERFTGAGLIDHLAGRADDISRANRALEARKQLEEDIARLRREGLTTAQAETIQLRVEENKLLQIRDSLAAAESRALRERRDFLQATFRGQNLEAIPRELRLQTLGFDDSEFQNAREKAATAIKELELGYRDLLIVAQRYPEIASLIADDLEAQAQAAGNATAAFIRYSVVVDEAIEKQQQLSQAVAGLGELGDVLDPQLEALRLESLELEQLKTKMGDAFGDANQARLSEVNRLIDLLAAKHDIAGQSVLVFGAMMREQYGEMAPAMIARTAAAISELPADKQIAIKVLLPDLAASRTLFESFIASLQAGASIEVALRFAVNPGNRNFLGGAVSGLPGYNPAEFEPEATDLFDEFTKKLEDFENNAAGPLGNIADKAEKVGKAAEKAAKQTAIWADGIISLGEAIDENLTPAMAAELELQHRAMLAVYALADAEFRLNVEREKAARAGDVLRIALLEIGAELLRSERTLEQWRFDEILRPKLDAVASMVDEIFGKPTRETLTLQLRLAELERRRLLLISGGAEDDDKRIENLDREIDAVRNAIALREREMDIMRLKTELADQTLQTDRDLANANDFLRRATDGLTGAAVAATRALWGLAGYTPAEMTWINQVARNRGEEVPFPSFQRGISYVPQTGPAMVHEGEAVLTAAENRQRMLGAGTPAIQIHQQFVVNADISDAGMQTLMRRIEQANEKSLRRAGFGGSVPPGGANR